LVGKTIDLVNEADVLADKKVALADKAII